MLVLDADIHFFFHFLLPCDFYFPPLCLELNQKQHAVKKREILLQGFYLC